MAQYVVDPAHMAERVKNAFASGLEFIARHEMAERAERVYASFGELIAQNGTALMVGAIGGLLGLLLFLVTSSSEVHVQRQKVDSAQPSAIPRQAASFAPQNHTPAPGPHFGRIFKQRQARRPRENGAISTPISAKVSAYPDIDSIPGYQTPVSKASPSLTGGSPDLSRLSDLAPTTYDTLRCMGMLDDQGTPTKKWEETRQRQKATAFASPTSSWNGRVTSNDGDVFGNVY
jgi:hypothetical protein